MMSISFRYQKHAPMGKKSSGRICNLVIHEIEKEILTSAMGIHRLYSGIWVDNHICHGLDLPNNKLSSYMYLLTHCT